MACYPYIEFKGQKIYYVPDLDGGGNSFGRMFAPFVERYFGRLESVFEWCAGPGFIGFSLLASGLCRTLDLADVNASCEPVVRATVAAAGIEDRVRFHVSDCLDAVPSSLSWDLLIGNPPHVNSVTPLTEYGHTHSPLIWRDADWAIHRRFYGAAPRYLRPGGSVLIQENHRFSDPGEFEAMIKDAGLEMVGAYECGGEYKDYYFVWSKLPEQGE